MKYLLQKIGAAAILLLVSILGWKFVLSSDIEKNKTDFYDNIPVVKIFDEEEMLSNCLQLTVRAPSRIYGNGYFKSQRGRAEILAYYSTILKKQGWIMKDVHTNREEDSGKTICAYYMFLNSNDYVIELGIYEPGMNTADFDYFIVMTKNKGLVSA
jgi:hypothetical protein